MKLHTEIITICDYANIAQDGKLNINGIFDEVRVQKFPGAIARAFLVASIKGMPDKSYKLSIKLENDNDEKAFPQQDLEIHAGSNGKINIVMELVGLSFKMEGNYTFVIYHGEDKVGSKEIKVMDITQVPEMKYKLQN